MAHSNDIQRKKTKSSWACAISQEVGLNSHKSSYISERSFFMKHFSLAVSTLQICYKANMNEHSKTTHSVIFHLSSSWMFS